MALDMFGFSAVRHLLWRAPFVKSLGQYSRQCVSGMNCLYREAHCDMRYPRDVAAHQRDQSASLLATRQTAR